MSEPDLPRHAPIPGEGGIGGKNETPYGLTKGQLAAAVAAALWVFMVAFGVAMTMQR